MMYANFCYVSHKSLVSVNVLSRMHCNAGVTFKYNRATFTRRVQEACEAYLVDVFMDANLCAVHAKRENVT